MHAMKTNTDIDETISAGDAASIENTHSEAMSISLVCSNGCRVGIELVPSQVLEFAAGNTDAKVVLHHGDPAKLLIIKPESAS
jgi:hypothetical protein